MKRKEKVISILFPEQGIDFSLLSPLPALCVHNKVKIIPFVHSLTGNKYIGKRFNNFIMS